MNEIKYMKMNDRVLKLTMENKKAFKQYADYLPKEEIKGEFETMQDLINYMRAIGAKDIKKVYVAGAISNTDKFWEPFEEACNRLKAEGLIPFDPAKLSPGLSQPEYMHICYACIDTCEAIFFLPNWIYSTGANKERVYGMDKGMPTYYM